MTMIHEPVYKRILSGKQLLFEPISRRVKIYGLPPVNFRAWLDDLLEMSENRRCDKLIFYVLPEQRKMIRQCKKTFPFIREGMIRRFFCGTDAHIYSLFLNQSQPSPDTPEERKVMEKIRHQNEYVHRELPEGYRMRRPEEKDAESMAFLYRQVFETYPTPMHDPRYILQMIRNPDVCFSVIEYAGSIVSACSADMIRDFNCAEMSDCATLPSHRGKGLISYQFFGLIEQMRQKRIQTLFSYSRSLSASMNAINVRHGFTYGGRMLRNSNIGGSLENMNIWFKNLP